MLGSNLDHYSTAVLHVLNLEFSMYTARGMLLVPRGAHGRDTAAPHVCTHRGFTAVLYLGMVASNRISGDQS